MCFLYQLYCSLVSFHQHLRCKAAAAAKPCTAPSSYTRVDVPGYGSMFLSDSESTSTFEIESPELDYVSDQPLAVSDMNSLLSSTNEDSARKCGLERVVQESTRGRSIEPVSILI
ncbi:hypothetical protein ISF_09828 [Cordyceps fumosorosea ARSEF 2679]|uniref:Uncharacterized protein n=1 Tax=Cordyceps fumosorosea (strain ARSEF 2679) TaxID=1081104 RepID=A0A167BI69_CORFA|nr:hypothetical protein ISF_09828 [Cordyceps fumosorosea ARSEF 2679]OAA40074.1 hypothetical protein ISF_09828 [Cordyceps fumosorosea ARSEF 2679]